MKLEYSTHLKVFDGSELKAQDDNEYSDATYTHRVASNADLAASQALVITPDNMAKISFIQISSPTESDTPPPFNLTLTDGTSTYTLTGITREFHAFGAWTAVTVTAQATALNLEWVLLGV